jgi:hypothetical protein
MSGVRAARVNHTQGQEHSMKTMTHHEAAAIQGGVEPISTTAILVSLAIASVAYVSKSIFDNWGDFKDAVADGWNNV